jgi:uncharacterized protein YqeY
MSNLSAQINDDLKAAMKAKDSMTLTLLRSLSSALKYAAIEKGGADTELDPADALAVVRKQVKQRQDSVTSFREGNRDDLAEKEEAEIAILEKYLPAAMSPEELTSLVEACIAEAGATSKKEMGAVMKLIQEKAAGRADNKALSQEVMKRLD